MSLELMIVTSIAICLCCFVLLVWMIYSEDLKFIYLWRESPWNTLGLCAILGFQVGFILMQVWYFVPSAYIPDPAMVERIQRVECHSPRCEEIVDDLLARAGAK